MVDGTTVGEVIDALFVVNERQRDYVLDECGALRKHMVVFVDGRQLVDRSTLSTGTPRRTTCRWSTPSVTSEADDRRHTTDSRPDSTCDGQ
jgi:hypothetical protein